MGQSTWGIPKRKSQRGQPSQTKNQGRKDGPQHQHLLFVQHEERLCRFLLQQQMERRLDGPQQEPRQPVQGLWHSLAYFGILLHILAYSGILWHTLAYSGILWHTLAYSCILWHTLAYSGILWHTLA